ncbi:MAG: SpoIIE family protein phosphatase, partial [Lachnospiraceae bacterium]|nr:SpoIIE family protein phosphatase [Lachnospiraceae bacterium]
GDGEMFGTDRTVEELNKNKDASCAKLLEGIWTSVGEFVGNAEQFDDLTMLALEYRG